MQPMRSHVMEGKGKGSPFFFLWVGGEREGFFQVVFGVENELSNVHFPCKFFFSPIWRGVREEQKVPQVLDMFPKGFHVAPHFYPI